MKLIRAMVRQELLENSASELTLRDFDALTEMQFELWYDTCYYGVLRG
jgi:hypothetical protein